MRVWLVPLALALTLSSCAAFVPSVAPLNGFARSSATLSQPVRARAAGSATWKAQLAFPNLFGGKTQGEDVAGKVEGLIEALKGQKKGFQRNTADGNWALIYEINANGSPALQKFSQNFESVGGSFANFDVSKNEFYNIANLFGGKGQLQATVEFGEIESKDTSRISCDIVDASIKFGPLPALPLPLRASGGWLDFLYLDQDLRITRGNRGGLFIHVRPELLAEKLAQ